MGFCALALVPIGLLAAQKGRPTQYDVEAVYLYQFGKFVEWPAKTDGPVDAFPICVMGRDPFGALLDSTVAGESIANLPLKAERVDNIDDAKRCRILYISPSEDERIGAILDGLQNAPVLTVSDAPDFATRGGMIQFVLQDDRVRFEINEGTAQKAGLSLSSQLLKVAAAVRGAPAGAQP
ncbi:MAG TPA: YfiR family protein [Candidatus Aquilonibacter sp.]|nr:YfiR family protein [Candidatus Aquilonibacter sp.]